MSTVPNTIMSSYGIICDAMRDVGKLRPGNDPDSEDLAVNQRRLNKLINFYMTQGLKLWLIENVNIPLVPPLSTNSGVPLYTLGPTGTVPMVKPLRVISGYYQYNNGNQYPLVPMSYPNEYENLSNLFQPGSINSYAVDKQQLTLNVYLWNPPDAFSVANGTVFLMLEVPVKNFVSLTDQMNFPIEWGLLLEWGLANQISTGQPTTVIARAAAMEKLYKDALEDWDVEDSDTEFQPDQRIYQGTGRFK
jgi:hypothetical protein